MSARELSADARGHDPSLGTFVELVRQDAPAVLSGIEKASWLAATDLYYLGFHFVESTEESLRAFGGAVLQMLLKRFGRNKLATAATAKLKSAGLVEKKSKRK